jgi:hypothetical protein
MDIKRIFWIVLVCCCWMTAVGQTYRVGDVYTAPDGSQGIIYYLHPDGSGGWVVALHDLPNDPQNMYVAWGEYFDVPYLQNQDYSYYQRSNLLYDTAGYANTLAIRDYLGTNSVYAAGIVDFENGWVLPSPAQMMKLMSQRSFISDALVNAGGEILSPMSYWTSAEFSSTQAWCVDGGHGGFDVKEKNISSMGVVRAVRSFTYEPTYVWSTGDSGTTITVVPEETTTYAVSVYVDSSCSGVAEQIVEVYPKDTTTITEDACDFFVWRGQTLWQSGEYKDTFNNVHGCDSLVVLQLTVNHSSHTNLQQHACDAYVWNGETYTESGVYTNTLTSENGCDSVVALLLTVSHSPEVTVTVTADTLCQGDSTTLVATSTPVTIIAPINVGDILCTDGTTVKPSSFAASGKTAQGVVFYVDTSGAHGWAVNLEDVPNNKLWAGYYTSGPDTDIPDLANVDGSLNANEDYDGYSNTQKIRAMGDASVYPAAWSVDFDGGWYLPAAGQLSILFSELIAVNGSLQIAGGSPFSMEVQFEYWSSTESEGEYAWELVCGGDLRAWSKTGNLRVRSVRNF